MLRRAKVLLWDEAPMSHKHLLEALERTSRTIRGVDLPFGGLIVILMGDWKQIPPVVVKGNRAKVIRACMLKSSLWPLFKEVELVTNMRVQLARQQLGEESADELQRWSDYLLRVGNGSEPVIRDDLIQVTFTVVLPPPPPPLPLISTLAGDHRWPRL